MYIHNKYLKLGTNSHNEGVSEFRGPSQGPALARHNHHRRVSDSVDTIGNISR